MQAERWTRISVHRFAHPKTSVKFSFPCFLVYLLSLFPHHAVGGGKVYLILGSDTAIWEGMDVARFRPTYKLDLYLDATRNASRVMDPLFRLRLVDSYGQPMKLTWWMMAGNIFRYATNANVPIPNVMTLQLMKKYHGEALRRYGDELSLHYHTFAWTDYDRDGKYFWNQARSFEECRDDFDLTMAQFLIEEQTHPVSFRSGWHAMDNGWQQYLDELLPYSMHNDWPVKHIDTVEPLDNIYDWSRSPSTWIPFHPSLQDYQIPGAARGWNLRSKHIGSVNTALMDTIFARAQRGEDQVACLWGHLPETDFLDNLRRIDSLAHRSAAKYGGVPFRYCSAVEAMQRWIATSDTISPELTVVEQSLGETVAFTIQTNEPIFQKQPFVAAKDKYERYFLLRSSRLGSNSWRTEAFPRDMLAKLGMAVTDTVGNLKTHFLRYLPDDIYVDNKDPGYSEIEGAWTTIKGTTWGVDSRLMTLAGISIARVRWSPNLPQPGRYNIFVQVPTVTSAAGSVLFRIHSNGGLVDSLFFSTPLPGNEWIFLGAPLLATGNGTYVEMVVRGENQAGRTIGADVVRFSPLVRERQLVPAESFLNFGEVSREDTVKYAVNFTNAGIGHLTVSGVVSVRNAVSSSVRFPIKVPAGGRVSVPIQFSTNVVGPWSDTLLISSDDPVQPVWRLPLAAEVKNYFQIADNDDSTSYREEGTWHTSVAQAYGRSSRYTNLTSPAGANATFSLIAGRSGTYDLMFIVPKTVNSANRALYVVRNGTDAPDSVVVDQNVGSGGWVPLRRYRLSAGTPFVVRVINTGRNSSGDVLRADALKVAWYEGTTGLDDLPLRFVPRDYELHQNFPNPFNSSTTIQFGLPVASHVRIVLLNILGQEIATPLEGELAEGTHLFRWNAAVTSGVYFYRMEAVQTGNATKTYTETKKMLIIR